MSAWKLIHQWVNNLEFNLSEGPNTIGRGPNQITTSTLSVSRNHCILHVNNGNVTIEDLGSLNGTYLDNVKVLPKVKTSVKENQKIGVGSNDFSELPNGDRFEFKLIKVVEDQKNSSNGTYLDNVKVLPKVKTSVKENQKIGVGSNDFSELPNGDRFEFKIIKVVEDQKNVNKLITINKDLPYKRKLSPEIINLDSDSESVAAVEDVCNVAKKIKFESEVNECFVDNDCFEIKQENYDEPISVDSDSESDMENDIWFLRLSQSSPGKPFLKMNSDLKPKIEEKFNNVIPIKFEKEYSNEEEFMEDIIQLPEPITNNIQILEDVIDSPVISVTKRNNSTYNFIEPAVIETKIKEDKQEQKSKSDGTNKLPILIDFLSTKTNKSSKKYEKEDVSSSKRNKNKSRGQKEKEVVKCTLSSSQKEERKKKLKEIAAISKEKINNQDTINTNNVELNNANKQSVVVKITTKNRGAFLSSDTKNTTKIHKSSSKDLNNKVNGDKEQFVTDNEGEGQFDEIEEHLKSKQKVRKARQQTEKDCDNNKKRNMHKGEANTNNDHSSHSENSKKNSKRKSKNKDKEQNNTIIPTNEAPTSKLVPLVEKLKIKKKVRFSTVPPEVRVFQIEPGNEMKKTRSIIDQQKPLLSASQNFLLSILRWNPQWLDEQMEQNVPPPILAHNNSPINLLTSYSSHKQYVHILTDLLLFEVWDTLYYTYKHSQNQWLELTLTSAVDSGQRFEIFYLSVNMTVSTNDLRKVPRPSEVMFIEFGPQENKKRVFVWVQHVKPVHSNGNRQASSFTLYLQVRSSKLTGLQPGEKMYAIRLSCIQNECTMFDAIDYLACSPLCEAILRPSEATLPIFDENLVNVPKTLHTKSLNASQLKAVGLTISAATDSRPSIQMIQGPPGTGKTSVICSIVMSYFYDENGIFLKDRGKVLICATSNAAVDELVIRLLNIRKTLAQDKRFRMVRVGRLEAMHRSAREISSVNLAQRHENMKQEQTNLAANSLTAEVAHLEAKINMWKSNLENTEDEGRLSYCHSQIRELQVRIARLRNPRGANGRGLTGESLFQAESSIVEGAHIVATTLSSAANRRLAKIKSRVAFCVIDEAGQATEPQALVPLTLGIRRLVLIGDPQQLPAYTSSISARTYGLSESLFARLSSRVPHASTLLDVQYRMQPDIADYPNRVFYGGSVRNAPTRRPSLPLPPYRLLAVNATNGKTECFPNVAESWCVSRLAAAVWGAVRGRRLSLAVITPYHAQADLIRKNIDNILQSEEKIEVCSVDSFQGQERDVVIVSVARLHGSGFAAVPARLNVLLTRARHSLLLCLNTNALETSHQWRTLIDDAKRRHMFRVLPDSLCLPGTSDDNILRHIVD